MSFTNLYIIFIIIGLCIVLYGVSSLEHFRNNDIEYSITYPSIDEIKEKLTSRQYFNFLKLTDAQARNIKLSYSDFQQKYSSCIIPITDEEKVKFNAFYKSIVDSIPVGKRHLFLIPNMKVAQISGIENDFPHTHNDIIFLNKSFFSSSPSAKTFIHEIVHIRQREDPTMYDSLFSDWGFQSISLDYMKQKLPNDIVSRIRINPDELPDYRFWVWRLEIIPLVIYSSFEVKNINDVKYIAIDWNKNDTYTNLANVPEYSEYFKISINHYHPNEILAEYYSLYYLEIIGESNTQSSEGYRKFVKFISQW